MGLAEGYSNIPVWMPIPLLAFLFYGPLIFDRWRGVWLAIGLGAAILIHLFSCRVFKGPWLALAQWVILAGTSLILYFIAGDTARQVDPNLYASILLVFVMLVSTLGLPLNRWLGDLLFFKKRQEYRDSFLKNLKNIQLFVKPVEPPLEISRFLREIQQRDMLDRVVMLSGVSGGSAGIAYFAAHRASLSDEGIPWQQYRSAMAEPYIRDVLAGAGEKRFLRGARLGQLLTESFEHRFLHGTLTDTASVTGEKIGKDHPTIPLTTAASLSANFPPVFSNAAVAFERNGLKNRYYVTDGGAVENRALISLLLALRASIINQPASGTPLPPVKILVADASAFSEGYKEDRGVGALGGAKARIASKLIGELTREIDRTYHSLSGERPTEGPDTRPGVEIVYLPMPEVLRISSAFGTHWMMPDDIEIRDPETPYLQPRRWYRPNGCPVDTLRKQELLKSIDLLFANNKDRNAGSTDAMRKLFEWFAKDDPRDVLDRALK